MGRRSAVTAGGAAANAGRLDAGSSGVAGSGGSTAGTCSGKNCCAPAVACAGICCNPGEVCSFEKCRAPGASCWSTSDCGADQYCEFTLGDAIAGSDACSSRGTVHHGQCLPRPPICKTSGNAVDCLESCQYHQTTSPSPALAYTWGGHVVAPFDTDVMMTPVVVQLDDDDCDGSIIERDIPEIVFSSFTGGAYTANGTLHAIAYKNGALVDKWSATLRVSPSSQIAGGEIDGIAGNEIVACGYPQPSTITFRGDGTMLWTSLVTCSTPSIADLDGDGAVEVIVEGGILNGKTGVAKHAFSPALPSFIVSHVDGNAMLNIITATRAYEADGTLILDTGLAGTWPAIADFNGDGTPEVVAIDHAAHTLAIWHYDARQAGKFSVVRAPPDLNLGFGSNSCPAGNAGYNRGGGPPVLADFDHDGTPDVGVAGGIGYSVFSGKNLIDKSIADAGTILWARQAEDCLSGATGSSSFDFGGDGQAEVLYADQTHLYVYDGATGDVLQSLCNTSSTISEYPVVADVDNDGHAEIVVVSNAYASGSASFQCDGGAQAGVRVSRPGRRGERQSDLPGTERPCRHGAQHCERRAAPRRSDGGLLSGHAARRDSDRSGNNLGRALSRGGTGVATPVEQFRSVAGERVPSRVCSRRRWRGHT